MMLPTEDDLSAQVKCDCGAAGFPPRLGQNLATRDGELFYCPGFVPPSRSQELFEALRHDLSWQEESITIAGRRILVPRMVCWYGDQDAVYRYSGTTHDPLTWVPPLLEIRRVVEDLCGRAFNSVLGNLYRDGQDSMGWHADREKSLGVNPCIASLSFGAARIFKLRHNRTKEILDLELTDGSLLLMGGSLQHHWRHCLPKSATVDAPRINLTFRKVVNTEG